MSNERWWHKAVNNTNVFIANINKYLLSGDESNLIKAKDAAIEVIGIGKLDKSIFKEAKEEIIKHFEKKRKIENYSLEVYIKRAENYREEVIDKYISVK